MSIKTAKELYVSLLSNAWHNNERAVKIYKELSQAAQDPEITSALNAREFITTKVQDTLNEAFRQLGEKPVPADTRIQEVFIEGFRKELAEVQSPIARRLFVLSKISHLIHLHIGQYVALVAAADLTGNFSLGVLLESALADKIAFAERTRRAIRKTVEERVGEKKIAA